MTDNILKKYRAHNSQNIQLPYLPKTIPVRQQQSQKQHKTKQFDLRTSNSFLPKYDPLKDKNLKSFFEKQTVRKVMSHLPPPRASSKTTITQSSRDRGILQQMQDKSKSKQKPKSKQKYREQSSDNGKLKTVTKESFLKYLEEVRERIKSNK